MQKPSRAMLVSIAAVLMISAALHLWQWLEPTCSSEQRRIIMKAAGGVGCFEFWLNRYQGFIGGVLALAGAVITVGVMRWQTKGEARRRRQVALMRALAEMRPFWLQCLGIFRDIRWSESTVITHELPELRFPRDPELLADLSAREASDLMHFALIVDRVRAGAIACESYGYSYREYVFAFSARFADDAFELIEDIAADLDWAPETDRPALIDSEYVEAMELAETLRRAMFSSEDGHVTPASA